VTFEAVRAVLTAAVIAAAFAVKSAAFKPTVAL